MGLFSGGKYDISESIWSILPGGRPAGLVEHPQSYAGYNIPGSTYGPPKGVLGEKTTNLPIYGPEEPKDVTPWEKNSDYNNPRAKSNFPGGWYNNKYFSNGNDFAQGVMAKGTEAYNRQAKQIQNAYNAGLLSYDEQVQALNQARNNIQMQMRNLTTEYNKSLKELATTRDDTLNSQSMYFNRISPEAYQSQQGVYQDKTVDNYEEGVADLKEQYRQNQLAQQQYLQQLASQQSALGRARLENEEKAAEQQRQLDEGLISQADALRNEGYQLPNFAPPTAPKFNTYDTTKYMQKNNELAIGQMLKGGTMDPMTFAVGRRNEILQDPNLTEEEKVNELAVLNFLYGMQ